MNYIYGKYILPLLQPRCFSTKNRADLIHPNIEDRVWSYIGGIARKHKMTALQVGGIYNHIHALVSSPPSIAPSQIAQWLKGGSSHWIHDEFQHLNKFVPGKTDMVCFRYVSHIPRKLSNTLRTNENITKRRRLKKILKLHEIEYDERYLFG
jgi:putative transposase